MSNAKIRYGQQPFDFNEGIMSFMGSRQILSIGNRSERSHISYCLVNYYPACDFNRIKYKSTLIA
jgi:hypothetical protein